MGNKVQIYKKERESISFMLLQVMNSI